MSNENHTPLDVATGLDNLLTNLPSEVILLHSPSGQIHFASHSAPSVFGEGEKLGGQNFLDKVHVDDRSRVRDLFLEAATRGTQPVPVTIRIKRYMQEDAWVVLFSVAVKDGSGRVIELHTTLRDVTKQIALRDRILESDKLSHMTNTLAKVGGWYYNVESGYLHWSDEVRKLYEVSNEFEPTMENSKQFFDDDDMALLRRFAIDAIETGEMKVAEIPMITAQNKKKWIRVILRADHEDGIPARLYGATQDITEIKSREQELASVVMELTDQRDQLEEFSHIMSHQLRAPITNLSSLVTLLAETGDEKERHDVQSALRDAVEALRLLFDDVSKAVRVRYKERFLEERLNVAQVANHVLERISSSLRDAGATVNIHTDECPFVDYPSVYLQAIFQQLITNAIRFAHSVRKPEVDIYSTMEDGRQVLIVSDNGAGIDLERFGDKMFRLESTFHRHSSGRGVGLFMVRTIVEALGGYIDVDSQPGVGSTFKIILHTNRTLAI